MAAMPNNTVADVVDVLGQHHILDAAQLNDARGLQRRCKDPRALLMEMVQRGWLSNFQAAKISQGRAAELVLGPYLLLDLLGQGGVGQVFKARHQSMGRICAIKLVRKELLSDPEVVARFYREIEVASHISHPNIVHALDAGPVGSELMMAMEYVNGINLHKYVKQFGKAAVPQACDFIRQAAQGLQYAHERGMIHRDIKPSNLLVTRHGPQGGGGIIKLLDFGLARLLHPGQGSSTKNLTVMAGTNVMQGTPEYMAPEQALDLHGADTRADIYSLGCTFYFLLAGQPPFASGNLTDVILKHQSAPPPPLDQFRKDVPPAVWEVIRKMLAKRLPDRYQVPGEVAQALAPFVPSRKAPDGSGMSQSGDRIPVPNLQPGQSGDRIPVPNLKPGQSGDRIPVPQVVQQQQRRSKVNLPSQKSSLNYLQHPLRRRGRPWLLLTCLTVLALVGGVGLFVFLLIMQGGASQEASSRTDTSAPRSTPRPEYTFKTIKPTATEPKIDKPVAKTGGGKDFDGKKDFIEVPDDPKLDPPELTVEAWVNPASIPNQDELRRWLVNKNTHEHTEGHYALMSDGAKVGAYVNIGGGEGNNIKAWSSADLLKPNKWQHLAMTWDGFSLRVFYDGKEVALNPASVTEKPRKPGKTPLVIGRRQDGYEKSYFHGKLDDIRIYDRPLKEEEIRAHFFRPDGPDKPDKSLVFQKRF
jgi:serine/threonine-protein kinase